MLIMLATMLATSPVVSKTQGRAGPYRVRDHPAALTKRGSSMKATISGLLLVGILVVAGCGISSGSGEQAKQSWSVKTTRQLAVGESADFPDRTVTVHAVSTTPATTPETVKPRRAKQFAAADVEVCAKEQIRENIFDFELGTSDNRRQLGSTRGAQPPFGATDNIAPGDCVRGYITYEIPQEATPTYVHYDGPQDERARWEV